MRRVILCLAFAMAFGALFCGTATAQVTGFNIDYGAQNAGGGELPPTTYGAAGAQPGFWNSPPQGTAPFSLFDLAGNATGAVITSTNVNPYFFSTAQGITGDDGLLLNDIVDGSSTFTVTGLAAGQYDVYTYAIAPDDPTSFTSVSVNGLTPQIVGGVWPGSLTLGVTHALHNVTINAGEPLTIVTAVSANFVSTGGIQIVPIPEPTSMALLGIPAVAGWVIRRRRAK